MFKDLCKTHIAVIARSGSDEAIS